MIIDVCRHVQALPISAIVVAAIRGWSKIIHFRPLIVPNTEVAVLEVSLEFFVGVIVAPNQDVGRSLNDWFCGGVEKECTVLALARSELKARNNEDAIGAVSDEGRGFNGSKKEIRLFAQVNSEGGNFIIHGNIALEAFLTEELLAFGLFTDDFVGFVGDHEILHI